MKNIDLTKKYALAVSGGVDSMVMLTKFALLSPRPDFFVVTVNHGIRQEAASDCQFVADYCNGLGIECRVFSVDAPAYCKQHKVSVETGARLLRYRVFDQLECDFVCLAHNANDNAETVLMHILRGSGAKGACGIHRQSGKYLRPILQLTREQIEQYACEHAVPYVNDSTNDDTKYTRNFVRHKVMPMLAELNPSAQQNILRFADNISRDEQYLETLADISSVQIDGVEARIPKQLLQQPSPIAYRALSKVFNAIGVFYDVEKTHLDAIVGLADNSGGKSVDLPFGLVAVNDYDFVTIAPKVVESLQQFEVPFQVGRTDTPLGVVEVSEQPLSDSLRLDISKLPANAVFRARRQGDSFTKFGGGTKPLKDCLIDKKIPQRTRDNLLLVANGSEVLVICGVEISDKVRVDDGAKPYFIKLSK